MSIECPHCNGVIELEVTISPKKSERFYITRKEYSVDQYKAIYNRKYTILEYDSEKDRFRVELRNT